MSSSVVDYPATKVRNITYYQLRVKHSQKIFRTTKPIKIASFIASNPMACAKGVEVKEVVERPMYFDPEHVAQFEAFEKWRKTSFSE